MIGSPVDCHNYEKDVEPKVNSTMVTQSMMLMDENFIDIPIENDNVDQLLHACCCKTHSMFEITKYIDPYMCLP